MLYNEATNDTHPYIGIDIGGTNTRIGLFSSLDTPRFELLTKFPTARATRSNWKRLSPLSPISIIPLLVE